MRKALCLGILLLTLTVARPARSGSASVLLEKGIYTEETLGDLESAIEIYEEVLEDARAERRYVAEAHYRLGMCHLKRAETEQAAEVFEDVLRLYPDQERIAAAADAQLARLVKDRSGQRQAFLPDPAVLMPPDTFLYVEAGSPGVQMEKVLNMLEGTPLENPLAAMDATPGGPSPGRMMAALMNPSMVKEFKKVEGAAFGLQSVSPQGVPSGAEWVALLYPGESDALRGILLASLQMAAEPGEPIGEMSTLSLKGAGGTACAFDERAVILASDRRQLEWAARQYAGQGREPSLLSASAAFAELSPEARRQDAATVWASAPGTLQVLRQSAAGKPDLQARLQMVDGIVDLQHMEDVTLRHTIGDDAVGHEMVVRFQDDHQSMAYNLVRTPRLNLDDFHGVPADAVAVASVALAGADSPAGAKAHRALQQATGLQIGRELFSNIRQINLFLLPPAEPADEGVQASPGGPAAAGVGVAIASHDAARTQQLIGQLLRAPAIFEGTAPKPTPVKGVDGALAYRLGTGEGAPLHCYVGRGGQSTVLALSPTTLKAAVDAAGGGPSALTAGRLQRALHNLPRETSKLLLVNAGGALALARAQGATEGMPQQAREALSELADALEDTLLRFHAAERPNVLTVQLAVQELPPFSTVFPAVAKLQAATSGLGRGRDPRRAPVSVARAENPIQVDGNLDDWAGAEPMEWTSGEAGAGTLTLRWDEDGLYGAVQSFDTSIQVNDAEPWFNDSLQVFIQRDNARVAQHTPASVDLIFWPDPQAGPGPANVRVWHPVTDTASTGKGTDEESGVPCRWARAAGGYTLEFLIPARVLEPVSPRAGAHFRLGILLRNGRIDPVAALQIGTGGNVWRSPEQWAPVRLAPGPQDVVSITRAPAEVVVDGSLADWAGVEPMPLPFMGRDGSSVHIAWSPRGLHVAVDARDEKVRLQRGTPWQADALELFVDKALTRGERRDENAEQYVLAPVPGRPGPAYVHIAYGRNQGGEDAIQSAWAPTEGGYVIEATIPAALLAPAQMQAGTKIGLHFALDDDGRAVEQFFCDKDVDDAYGKPAMWGVMVLSGAGAADVAR